MKLTKVDWVSIASPDFLTYNYSSQPWMEMETRDGGGGGRDRIQTGKKITIPKSNWHKRKKKNKIRAKQAEIENNQI